MKVRPSTITRDLVLVPLAGGLEAMVDIVDLEIVANRNWRPAAGHACRTWYAMSSDRAAQLLHRLVAARMGLAIADREVDHRNGNGLDCRRHNLRAATVSQNQQNAREPSRPAGPGKKGVRWTTSRGRMGWRVRISASGRRHELGLFGDRELAEFVYEEAALKFQGEFARP